MLQLQWSVSCSRDLLPQGPQHLPKCACKKLNRFQRKHQNKTDFRFAFLPWLVSVEFLWKLLYQAQIQNYCQMQFEFGKASGRKPSSTRRERRRLFTAMRMQKSTERERKWQSSNMLCLRPNCFLSNMMSCSQAWVILLTSELDLGH